MVTAAADAELLATDGSAATDWITAVLVAAPTVVALTLIVTANVAAGASVPRSQVTRPAACVQVAPLALE